MKKILFSLLLTCVSVITFAQTVITGKVSSADDGAGLPGVSVAVQGTTRGTITDVNGNYSISASQNENLVYSFVGMQNQVVKIGTQSVINISLVSDENSLSEVVVTGAYGTSQSIRSATYAAQVLDNTEINTIRQSNLNNMIAGKVAGIQVRSQSTAALGRQSEVRLRGATGFGTRSGALYVVDGTILPNIDDINNDDIENVSILQGPAASAQFGSQGANGAIVITTKKGTMKPGLGITLNSGVQFDKVYILPNYQNSYAGGASSELIQYNWKAGDPAEWKALDGKFYHDYSDDASWGPRMVGQEYIPWYSWYGGHSRSYTTTSLDAQPNNAKDFFQTGVFANNTITVSKALENLLFKVTYGNQYTKGLIPTTSLAKNTFNVNTTYDINKHLEVSANITYSNTKAKGQIDDAYSSQSTGSFNQWYHRNLDMGIMRELRDLKTPDGILASWNHANPNSYDASNPGNFYKANYWYNFYTYFDQNSINNNKDRLFGNVAFKYKIIKGLDLTFTYRKQQEDVWNEQKYNTDLYISQLQTTGNDARNFGFYSSAQSNYNRRNIELLASYDGNFNDFSIKAIAGSDFYKGVFKANGGNTNQGLSVPNLFSLTNSVNPASYFNNRWEEAYNAVFGKATFGFRNLLFADITLRNDWFSTLPPNNNSVLSKSFGASFIFSELTNSNLPWLTFGKLRYSWGEVPKALGVDNETFGAYRYPGSAYSVNQFKWGSNFLMTTPNQVVDPNIRGSVAQQQEVGIDLQFVNRFGLGFTYWNGTEVGFPYALTVNGASGFNSILTNIGKIAKAGIEIKLDAKILKFQNFTWNAMVTYADLMKNDVVELSKKYEITQTSNLAGVWGSRMPYMVHTEGKRWGQIYGNGIKRINGEPVLATDGSYVNDPNVYFGSVLPRFTGGLQNSFTIFKNFLVNANIDYQVGGKFVSLSNMWGSFSGLTARTATVNDKGNPIRDAVANGGGVHVSGVNADGAKVDYYVEAQDYFHNIYNKNAFDPFVYDLTFVKLRELSIGYSLPVKKLGWDKVTDNITFSVVSRDPLLIFAKTADFDPSIVSAVNGETAQLPGTRSIGFNLRVGF